MKKIVDNIKKVRSYTILDIFRFLGNFAFAYFVFTVSLYLSKVFDLTPPQDLTTRQWQIILIGGIPMAILTYLREIYVTAQKNRQIQDRKLIYDCIGGAIEQLIEIKSRPFEAKTDYTKELLKYMEKVISLVLKEYGIHTGEICVNLMVKKENPLRLDLMYFGTFLAGRKKIIIPVNPDALIPGAPEAYSYRKTMYINNTMSNDFKNFFDENKPYRSIISIPIIDINGEEVFAVLNIDSDFPDQFVGKDFIDQKIIPTINPLVLLLQLEKDLILNMVNNNGGM